MVPLRKNILITGASSGLGEGMARRFAARGPRGHGLALCARRTDRLDALAKELRAANPGIEVVTRGLDVNDHASVFAVFREFRDRLGSLDRVIVNAGLGKGRPIGTGGFDVNRRTVETNFVAALAQVEAAVGVFREQGAGHLVVMSSFSALRGLPGSHTAYAASKAGLSALAGGARAELHGTPIKVTTLLPGYIESEMNDLTGGGFLVTKAEAGAKALVEAIESETAKAYVPSFPWTPLSAVMRMLPAGLLKRFV